MNRLTLGTYAWLMRVAVLGSLIVVIGTGAARAQGSTSALTEIKVAEKAAILLDPQGRLVGSVEPGSVIQLNLYVASITLTPMSYVPGNVVMSSLAPPVSTSQTSAVVKVPSSLTIAFCGSGSTYDRFTGLCGDGKPPYKIVPVASLGDPAAKTSNVTCTAPKVATFNATSKTWGCLVPLGFNRSRFEK